MPPLPPHRPARCRLEHIRSLSSASHNIPTFRYSSISLSSTIFVLLFRTIFTINRNYGTSRREFTSYADEIEQNYMGVVHWRFIITIKYTPAILFSSLLVLAELFLSFYCNRPSPYRSISSIRRIRGWRRQRVQWSDYFLFFSPSSRAITCLSLVATRQYGYAMWRW